MLLLLCETLNVVSIETVIMLQTDYDLWTDKMKRSSHRKSRQMYLAIISAKTGVRKDEN